MMQMFASIEAWLQQLSHTLSLEVFALVGSFLEEVISPIPSVLVLGLVGTLAQVQGVTKIGVLLLAVLSSTGKTTGTLLYYVLGDVLEDVVVPRYGKYMGVTHVQVERIGARFTGRWMDGVILGILRMLPFSPNTAISLVCGVIKMRLVTYLIATFVGNFCKDCIYIGVWYLGLTTLRAALERTDMIVLLSALFICVSCVGICGWWWKRRQKSREN